MPELTYHLTGLEHRFDEEFGSTDGNGVYENCAEFRDFCFCACRIARVVSTVQQAALFEPSAPVSDRVHDLLSRMTLDEKVAQLQSRSFPSIGLQMPSCFERHFLKKVIDRTFLLDGVGTFAFVDEFLGWSPGGPRESAIRRNLLQTWVLDHTSLRIPIMFHGEALHGAVTNGGTVLGQFVKHSRISLTLPSLISV
jgi:hypothetical protein